VLLAAVAAACGVTDPLDSSDVVGRYVLTSVGGAWLPASLGGDTGAAGPTFWYASEMVLRSDGTYTRLEVTGPRGVPRDTSRDTNTWRLQARGGADTLWATSGYTSRSRYEIPYAVRRGGRELFADRTLIGSPLPARRYERQ
jgi:hypothetical protein